LRSTESQGLQLEFTPYGIEATRINTTTISNGKAGYAAYSMD
jgi:hypothetical protein